MLLGTTEYPLWWFDINSSISFWEKQIIYTNSGILYYRLPRLQSTEIPLKHSSFCFIYLSTYIEVNNILIVARISGRYTSDTGYWWAWGKHRIISCNHIVTVWQLHRHSESCVAEHTGQQGKRLESLLQCPLQKAHSLWARTQQDRARGDDQCGNFLWWILVITYVSFHFRNADC